MHAADGSYVRIGIRIPVRVLRRLPHLLPHPYAKSEDYLPGIRRHKAEPHRSRTAHYRKDYQEECIAQAGNAYHETVAESTYH